MYVSGDESSLRPGLTMSTALTGTSAGVSGIIKTMHTGLARTRIALCQRPGADTEETGRYDLARGKICVVFRMPL